MLPNFLNILLPGLLVLVLCACNTSKSPTKQPEPNNEFPAWMMNIIYELERQQPNNPPAKIIQYEYRGKIVYWVTGRCCDIPSELYDNEGTLMCQPDGGFTGKGDGRCPDFFEQRKDEKMIWEEKAR